MLRKLLLFAVLFSVGLSAQNQSQSVGFKENKGQIIDQKGKPNPAVRYLLTSGGLNVQLKKNGFSYDVYETAKIPLAEKDKRKKENLNRRYEKKGMFPDYSLKYVFHRVDVGFEGSNPNVELLAEDKSKDYDNYYTLTHAPQGILMVHQYKKITYKNIYPNIDVLFFVPEDAAKTVEYNFIIRPGGKASDIRMKFNGVKTDLEDGKIRMETHFGTMEETLPLSWTENGNKREKIAVGYKKLKKNVYGFDIEKEVTSDKTIVIDPVPVRLWGTYYGGSDFEFPYDIKIDPQDGIHIIGSTMSLNNIATAGSYQSTYSGDFIDCFIAKFNSDGVRLWGTYAPSHDFGGNRNMAIDSDSNIYMGSRQLVSTNLATPGAYQTVKNLYYDTYLMKYSSLGFLLWTTYYGGDGNDDIGAICTDSLNNVYVVGDTSSSDTLASPGAHQETGVANMNGNLGFIAKFSPNGQRIWGTFFGGQSATSILGVCVSDDNFLYLAGMSAGDDASIATPGAYLESVGNSWGGFITKFSLDGTRIWGTFTAAEDIPHEIVTTGNSIYVEGYTTNEATSTPGTFMENIIEHPDSQFNTFQKVPSSFITKFNTQTQQKVWGTYFFERINDIAINDNDEVYFCGHTNISAGIATPNGYQPTKNPNMDKNYIVKLNGNGQRIWGTYFGGNQGDYEAFISLDSFKNLYLFGLTNSTTGISTAGAFQTEKNGTQQETFLVKFKDCLSFTTVTSNSPVCINDTIALTASGGSNYSWTGPNGFTSTLQNPTILNASILNAGEYFCTITGTGGCDDTLSVVVAVGDTVAPVLDVANLPTITGTCNTLTIPTPTATDACMGVITATTTSPLVYTLEGTYTIVWNYDDGNGNSASQNQTVIISVQPLPVTNTTVTYCIQENKTLADITITGQNIKWYDNVTGGNLLPDTTLLVDGITYHASQTISGCESARIPVTATIQNTFGPTGFAVQYFCVAQASTLADFVVTGTDVVFYDSQFGGSVLPMNTPLVDDMGYWASQTLNGCESSLRTPFISDIINNLPANDYAKNVCDNLNDAREKVDLSDYNEDIIAASSGYSFSYYTDFAAADNEIVSNEITDFGDYELQLGENIIYVRVENTTLCYKVVALQLTLIATPIFKMLDTYEICEGFSKTITADAGFYTYTWSTGELSQSITVTEPGTYGVTVTEYHGDVICGTTKSITVVASNKATITSIATSDWTADENMLTVFVTGLGDYEYSLDGEHYQSSNQFTGLENGEYVVYVKDINGCGVVFDDVYLLMYPKFFTPNADGYNDSWGIKFYKNEPNMMVRIFDRYGKFIKQLTDTDPLWDGTHNGQIQSATDYWFTVTRENGKEHTGHFSLKK